MGVVITKLKEKWYNGRMCLKNVLLFMKYKIPINQAK